MVKVCAVGECKKRSSYVKCDELKFFTLPRHTKDPVRRQKWVDLCGRKDLKTGKPWRPREQNNSVYICSQHFVQGKPSQVPSHPDFLPNQNLPSSRPDATSGETSVKRYQSKLRRSLKQLATPCVTPSTHEVDLERDKEFDDKGEEPTDTPEITPAEPNVEACPQLYSHTHASCDVTLQVDIERENLQWLLDEKDAEIDKKAKKIERQEKRIASLECKVQYLEASLNTVRFSSTLIFENDLKSAFYTGLNWAGFLTLYTFLTQFLPEPSSNASKISKIDQFFYTLVRLRQNDSFEKLADHAGTGKTTMIDYFWRWVDLLFAKCRFMIQWPERDLMRKINPPHFRMHFPQLTCIIDCFEIFIESAGNLKTRAQTYSNYKSHTTAKYLIGCNPLGAVTFLSRGWGGRASDIHIVKESGFINPQFHYPGDQILADRGFTFSHELASVCGAELIIPSFIRGKDQFSAKEVEVSRKIASVRIHIERVIGLIKNRFAILQQTIPIRMVQSLRNECTGTDFSSLDKIVSCCAILVNMGESIVYRE